MLLKLYEQMKIIQGKHKKRATEVDSIEQIKPLIDKMVELCNSKCGIYNGGKALAHAQVDHDNPLRFFIFKDGHVVINPVILSKENKVSSMEGCLSFSFRPNKKVARYNEIVVAYQTIREDGEVVAVTEDFEGDEAFIMQHEIDHMNCKTIY